jgi:ketosteroid isomerase-like protein
MTEISFVGGGREDQTGVARQHQAYLDANATVDWEKLPALFSAGDDATYFNLNGHTYNGRAHWTRLWKYYKEQLAVGNWVAFDARGTISGDLAVVWCHRRTRLAWVGNDPRPTDLRVEDKEFISRSTMVFRREDGDWRVVHVHFSSGSDTPRPGGI